MLILAVHEIESVTAKVPFVCMVLSSELNKGSIPPTIKLRQIIPTSGLISTTMWEAPDQEGLNGYLQGVIGDLCKTSLYDVVEEYAVGIKIDLEKERLRDKAATASAVVKEKVAAAALATSEATASVAASVSTKVNDKFHLSEKWSDTIDKISERSAGAAASAKSGITRVVESEAVAAGMSKLGKGLGWMRTKFGEVSDRAMSNVRDYNESPGLFVSTPAGEANADGTGAVNTEGGPDVGIMDNGANGGADRGIASGGGGGGTDAPGAGVGEEPLLGEEEAGAGYQALPVTASPLVGDLLGQGASNYARLNSINLNEEEGLPASSGAAAPRAAPLDLL